MTCFKVCIALVIVVALVAGCHKPDSPSYDDKTCRLISAYDDSTRADYFYDGDRMTGFVETVNGDTANHETFEYDAQGRVVVWRYELPSSGGFNRSPCTVRLTYSADDILVTGVLGDSIPYFQRRMVYLNGGPKIAYDVNMPSGDTATWRYEGDNPVEYRNSIAVLTFKYDNRPTYQLPISDVMDINDIPIFLPHPLTHNPTEYHLTTNVLGYSSKSDGKYNISYNASGYPATIAGSTTVQLSENGKVTQKYTVDSKEHFNADCK